MDFVTLAVFCSALFIAAGSPGPGIAALVARVVARGWRDVLPFLAAMWVGEIIWLLAALAGLSAVAERFHVAFNLLRWAGVAYLLWLAVKMWRRADIAADEAAPAPERGGGWKMFASGLALTLGNPKVMVFYVALLPSLIDMRALEPGFVLALCVATLLTLAVVDLGWTFAANKARQLLRSARAVRIANKTSAVVMGGAAAAIAAKS